MTQRCEQRGRKLCLLSGELRRIPVGHELCPFDRDRHDACDGIEGADIECRRQRCEQPDRSCAVPQGNNQHVVLLADTNVTAICTLMGVELPRACCRRHGTVQHRDVDGDFLLPALQDPPAAIVGKADRHPGQLEAMGDMPRQHFDCARGLRGQKDVPRQIEQTGQFVAPGDGLARPILCRRRQIAGDDGHRQEYEQGDPVLRLGDGEGANRRQEEEVQREHRRDRRDERYLQARHGRGTEHDQQQRHCRRRRADVRNHAEQPGYGGNRGQAAEQHDDIRCRPWIEHGQRC